MFTVKCLNSADSKSWYLWCMRPFKKKRGGGGSGGWYRVEKRKKKKKKRKKERGKKCSSCPWSSRYLLFGLKLRPFYVSAVSHECKLSYGSSPYRRLYCLTEVHNHCEIVIACARLCACVCVCGGGGGGGGGGGSGCMCVRVFMFSVCFVWMYLFACFLCHWFVCGYLRVTCFL